LLSATRIPPEVRDTQNVPYNLCVIVAGCPPWKERPFETLIRTQTDQMVEDYSTNHKPLPQSELVIPFDIRPDVDYFALNHKREHTRTGSDATTSSTASRKSSVRRALSTLGSMPELRHPKPQRASYHEILVHGYGNGTNTIITAQPQQNGQEPASQRKSSESGSESAGEISSRWSNTSGEGHDDSNSPTTSVSSQSRRGSDYSMDSSEIIKDFLNESMDFPPLARVSSSVYSDSEYGDCTLQPEPLEVKKIHKEEYLGITTEVKVDWEDCSGKANQELLAYLNA